MPPKKSARLQGKPPAPPLLVRQAKLKPPPKNPPVRLARTDTQDLPVGNPPDRNRPTWTEYQKMTPRQRSKVGVVPQAPSTPAALKKMQIPELRDGCCRTGEVIVNDFTQYGGVPFETFLRANKGKGVGRTFAYAYESQADRLNRKARGGTEPVLKFGRSSELGRLYEYYNRHGTVEEGDFTGAFLLGLQDIGPRKPDDMQGPKRSHVFEAALHRLAKTKVPEEKRRKRGWETHFFNSMEDAASVFNDPSLKRIKVENAPARRSERAKTTRDCVRYGIFKEGEGLLRYEAAPGMENLDPRPARWLP